MTITHEADRAPPQSATLPTGAMAKDDRVAPDATPRPRDRLRWTVIAGGVLSVVGGLAVVIAWFTNSFSILTANASATPIVFNTGIGFIVIGVALVASLTGHNRLVLVGAAVAALLGAVTLLEHALDRGLGVDQLLFHTSVTDASGTAGRLAPNTAACFLAVSAALAWRVRGPARGRTIATATAGGLVLAVAGAGFALGDAKADEWGGFRSMGVLAAGLFVVVGTTLLVVMWRDPQRSSRGVSTRVEEVALPRQQWSVRRVVGVLAVIVYLPIGLLAYLSITWSWQAIEREAGASAENAAALEAQAVALEMDNLRTFAASLATRSAVVAALTRSDSGSLDLTALQTLLDVAVATEPGVASIVVTDPDGILLSLSPSTPDAVGRDDSLRDWYEGVHRTRGQYVSETVQTVAVGQELVVAIASPIRNSSGGPVIGYLSVGYPVTAIQDFTHSFHIDRQISFTITDQQGVVVASPNQTQRLVSLATEEPVRRALAGSSGFVSSNGPGGRQFIGYAPVAHIGWTVTANISASNTVDRMNTLRAAMLGIALVLGAALTVALTVVSRGWQARRVAERDLARMVAELGRSNEELQLFAYAASHDLSEPLRAVSGPISLVAKRYHGQLDPEADQLIEFAVDGCQRMQQIIDGLLVYSRVGRLESAFRPADCNLIVSRVLAALGPAIEDSGATVNVGTLPTVTAEANQLGLVLQNLIANAVKFARPDVAPIVSVEADRIGNQWRFSVTDNGIGIAPEHRERIFGMFKRLHSREQYPGTGIGLALAKKIVERHGGRIGVDDAPDGLGSRFWFTLPSEQA